MNAIKVKRTQNGLSQADLAKLLGVSQQAITQWETGKAMPRGETLIKLADLFGCAIDELCGRCAHEAPPGPKELQQDSDHLQAEARDSA